MLNQVVTSPFAISLIGVLLFLALGLEWRKSMAVSRKVTRSVALIMLGVGLLGLIMKPKIKEQKKGATVAYLTENYSQHTLDSLKKAFPKLKVFVTELNGQYQIKANSIDEIMNLEPAIDEFHIIGSGVDVWSDSIYFPVHLWPTIPNGVIAIDAPQQLEIGDSAWISLYTNFNDSSVITLGKPGGELDSTIVHKNKMTASFFIKPEAVGQQLYKVSIKSHQKNIEEVLAVSVIPRLGIRVLMINNYPTFESRYLKSWLAAEGHGMTVRNKVSEGKYRYEYVQMPTNPFNTFDANLYDITILDGATFNSLTKNKLLELVRAVESGMGLYLHWDNLVDHHLIQEWFDIKNSKSKIISYHGHELTKAPYQFGSGRLTSTIVQDGSDDEVVAQKRLLGNGAVSMSFINETYPLLLQGKMKLYGNYWGSILSSITTKKEKHFSAKIRSAIPRVDHPLDFDISTMKMDPAVLVSNYSLPLIKDINLTDKWRGTHWPLTSGWAALSTTDDLDSNFWFYVYPKNAWSSVRTHNNLMNTKARIQDQVVSPEGHLAATVISSWLWYATILCGLAVLWIEPKV